MCCKICTLAVKTTGNDERLRCLTLINNICRSFLQQLAVNDNSSGFQELTMHSSTWTRPTAAATTGWLGDLQLDLLPASVPILVLFFLLLAFQSNLASSVLAPFCEGEAPVSNPHLFFF